MTWWEDAGRRVGGNRGVPSSQLQEYNISSSTLVQVSCLYRVCQLVSRSSCSLQIRMAGVIVSLVVLLAATSIQLTHACSCMPDHPQSHACKADFVILARILSRRPTKDPTIPEANYIGYKLKITQVFKSNAAADEALLRTRFVTTPMADSMCGVQLKIKQLYLVTGTVHDGRAYINLCSFVRPWNHLMNDKGCGWNLNFDEDKDCQQRHSLCESLENGMCGWENNRYFSHCVAKKREDETRSKSYNEASDVGHNGREP
ncbi:hypothetical protein B566_EDAN014950 [Ephemera danica]|nr:hypothetical protein B566_EDAN014950 [Ephemera danica]